MERPKLIPKQKYYGDNGTKLNYNEEHILKSIACVKGNEFIEKYHMTRTADGQPLGYALDNSQNYGL